MQTKQDLFLSTHPVWAMSTDAVLSQVQSREKGLGDAEIRARKKSAGPNVIHGRFQLTPAAIFFRQFASPLILMLIVAGVVTIVIREMVDAAVIFLAVVVNTGLGCWQEYKAESVLQQLKSYVRTRVRVRRSGHESEIDAAELVPGDIIRISQGDRIPADARVIRSNQLAVDEAVLTGESLPAVKRVMPVAAEAVLGDRSSMLWSGTLAVEGLGEAVVTATGSRTEFGRIAALSARRAPEPTPLQRSVSRFAGVAGLSLVALAGVLFFGGVMSGISAGQMFILAVAVAVSVVPEGLPVALTVIFAVGVERLAKRKGVVRRLIAAETLGSTSIILTDKTGTLTLARMSLVAVVPRDPHRTEAETELLRFALSTTDVVIEDADARPEDWTIIGRPMEAAIVRGAAMRGIRSTPLADVALTPFSSVIKFSSATITEQGRIHRVIVGAPEIVLGMCEEEDGDRGAWIADINRRAASGERLLGVALQDGDGTEQEKLLFQGIMAFRDPIRPTVKDAVLRMTEAGVRTVIVTGDHPGTAESVAREIGILDGRSGVMTGSEMASLSVAELDARLDSTAVFARVTPEQKMELVKRFHAKGEVVAVTGDGVNDAPALEEADIGVAVGSGTEVAKSAADLVLLDDDFNTLVAAIEEGRRARQNVRKVIVYLLSDAFDELVLIAGSMLLGLPIPITALQILFVNFFSDSFPAIAYAFERSDGDLSRMPLLSRSASVIDRGMRFLIFAIGLPTSVLLLLAYAGLVWTGTEPEIVRTFIFAAFSVTTLFVAFSLRSFRTSLFHMHPFGNRPLAIGVFIGVALTIAAVYVPLLQSVLHTVPLPFPWALAVLGMAFINVLIMDYAKRKMTRATEKAS